VAIRPSPGSPPALRFAGSPTSPSKRGEVEPAALAR
jgi:hypothetical protein